MKSHLTSLLLLFAATSATAAPATYDIDPDHTHPSFEADHFGGLSVWRGFFRKTSGAIVLDKSAGAGTVDISVDTASVDVGVDKVNTVLVGHDYFESAKYPTAHYTGTLGGFVDGAPTVVKGTLTMHGVTKPVDLKVLSFKCVPHPLLKRDWCGADAYAVIDREDFGMTSGKDWGFHMEVILRIQVEAIIEQ